MNALLQEFQKRLKKIADSPFTWETLILLSVFSWTMSLLAAVAPTEDPAIDNGQTSLVAELLARLGWLFLTVGVGWGTHPVKWNLFGFIIRPGPWITGALACGLVFVGWNNNPVRYALVAWPIVSALIATIPKFIRHGPAVIDPRVAGSQKYAADRQEIINLMLWSILFSSWLQFHYLLQTWVQQYPSLLADDVKGSAFVQWVSEDRPSPRGVVILNTTASVLQEEFSRRSWPEVERWLLNAEAELNALRPSIFGRIPEPTEAELWDLQPQLSSLPSGYTLQLQAIWRGPSSQPGGYYLEKRCEITQAPLSLITTGPANAPVAVPNPIACTPVSDKISMQSGQAEL